MTNITIIGAGVSGVFLTIQLIRNGHDLPLNITLIEKEKEPWLGVAYSTDKPFHLLNVRASKMSALAGEEDHFLSWLAENDYKIYADDFAPRSVFRKYVKEVFQKTLADKPANINFKFIHEEAVDIKQVNQYEAIVHLRNKQTVFSNFIVLALGNLISDSSLTEALYANSPYYDNPWKPDLLDHVKKDAAVFILGTGPTMIDTALGLYYQRHEGKITAISRHGLIPAEHAMTKIYPDFSADMENITSLAEAVKIVRKHIAIAEENDIGWRAVIDAMRPYTRNWWLNISVEGKINFIKHYKTYWEVSRSRIPEECAIVIKEMMNSGQLHITSGRITALEKEDSRIIIKYTNTKTGSTHVNAAEAVINCMGPGLNFEKIKHPLVQSLLKQGLLCNSPASYGVNALPDGAIIKKDGTASKMMFTLGLPLRGVLWETIAIPEIRMQAKELAELILQKIIQGQIF